MTQLATYELDGRIATVTLDDGKVNALSIEMLRAVHAAFDQAQSDRAVVLLTGRERSFSAGFDLGVFGSGDGPRIGEMLMLGATLAERILTFETPVVIASPGHAVAAGSFLLLAADVRVGADGPFRVGLNEVKIGLTVPWFVIELARHRLNPAHFDRAVIDATLYSPTDAIAAGFLDAVAAPQDVHAAGLAHAAELAELDAAAYAATKQRARGQVADAVRAAIESEIAAIGAAAAG
jgi:enoyl-CoA hydratase/carnithine racemase